MGSNELCCVWTGLSPLFNTSKYLLFWWRGVKNHQIMRYASGAIVIDKNLGQKLKEWWFIIPSLCGLFASLCGNASLLLLFIHWLQLLLLFLGPGSHRQKLRNWCWELVFPVADAQATPGWLTAAAAANNRKWKEICLKMEKERAGGRKGIMCWTARSLHIFYFMFLNIILSLHKLFFGSLMGRELFCRLGSLLS